jgi:hypothetical protein
MGVIDIFIVSESDGWFFVFEDRLWPLTRARALSQANRLLFALKSSGGHAPA